MISMPPPSQSLVENSQAPLSRPWSQFIRKLIESVGLSPAVRVYRDLFVGGHAADLSVGAVAMTAFIGNVYLPAFGAGVDDGVSVVFRLPNDYREGTPLQPWLEWAPVDATAGDVDWRFEYLALRDATDPGSSATSLDETSAAPLTAKMPERVEFDEITDDARRGDTYAVRLWRLGTGDTYATGAYLLGCGLKYAVDGVGAVEIHP